LTLFDSLVAAALPVTPRFVVGRVARRYIAGETIESAVGAIRKMNQAGVSCTVDVLGEFIHDLSEARETAAEYGRLQDAIAAAKLDATVSIKLTAFGLLLDEAVCEQLVRGLVEDAAAHGSFVRLDMEDSPCTDRTLALTRRLHADGLPVGTVLQSYLRRTVDDARALAADGIPVRLCKGIYREPPEIAFQEREEVRQNYRDALRALLEGGARVGIATHDEVLVADAQAMVADLAVDRERFEFQMLLGVRPWLREEIVAKGYKTRVYVPYGAAWHGYSVRRLRENPAIAGHVMKAMLGFK
jgi:proline dehydrogenase